MKIRNLLLGSIAAAGLSASGAYAADLGVLTSLDVCDSLGLSGLTISSDTNCLQITGEVMYSFSWGDYDTSSDPSADLTDTDGGTGDKGSVQWTDGNGNNDWDSTVEGFLKLVATADSDFGPAKAVLKLTFDDSNADENLAVDEAYVAIGDSTVIMAGLKGSVFNNGDDEPLNFLGLFGSEIADTGVSPEVDVADGGHVIQVVADLGNGVSVSGGLEDLHDEGTAVGVIAYKGDGLSAHASFKAGDILDGNIDDWAVHAGFAGTFDNFKVVAAGAFDSNDYWNVLASASATFDMFELAVSGEATSEDEWGVGASIGASVSEGVKLNLGGRMLEENDGDQIYQVAAQVVAEVTESITLTGEVGYVDEEGDDLFYGSGKLAWAPGGDFTSSVKATVNSNDAYKIETEFKKTFQ
jgi:hypothetical protein